MTVAHLSTAAASAPAPARGAAHGPPPAGRTITAKLVAIALVFVAIVAALLAVVTICLDVVGGVRAYVGAESLWSKGQKDAVYALARYARTGDAADFRRYERAIAIPLGHRRARLELDRADPDLAIVEDGFVAGGNDPADVPAMVFLYRRFGAFDPFARAIAVWAAGDRLIEEIGRLAAEVRGHVERRTLTPALERRIVAGIAALNDELTPLERRFSEAVGAGARQIHAVAIAILLSTALVLLALGLVVSWRIARGIREGILALREGALRVAAGDLARPIAVRSRDELGELATVFNEMVAHRAAVEEALRSATEFRDTVMESASNAIYALDAEGRFLLVNRRTCEITGYEPEELLGRFYTMLVPPELVPDVEAKFRAVVASGGTTANAETTVIRKDGRRIDAVYTNAPLRKDGRVIGVAATAEDVTERKQAQAERDRMLEMIAKARDEAVRASQARSDFLAGVSHEIRTPMNPIIGLTGLLLDGPLGDEQREHVQMIRSSAESLLALINDVLDFSKIDAGKLAIEPIPFEVETIVGESVDLFRSAAKAKGVAIEVRTAGAIPRRLVGDPGRIRQILTNLVGNAVKFTHGGSVQVDVRIAGQDDAGPRVRFSVTDTGIGIPKDAQVRIFDKFVQADASTSRKYGGTGLGLAISKQLAVLMGGEIGFESEPGRGSTFWFVLPLRLPTESEDASAHVPPRAAPVAGGGAVRARVLLVEDNPVNQKVARLMLERLGCRIDTAADGREGVRMVCDVPYDLVFMDCQMPEMDGYEATREIRRLESGGGRRVPIVALTAHAMSGDRERCLEAGMDDYLTKPLRSDDLRAVLERFAPAAASAVDPELLANLESWRELDGEESVRELFALFWRTTKTHLAELRVAVEARDLATAALLAHGLKGSTGTFGAKTLESLARATEAAVRSGEVERLPELLERMERAAERLESGVARVPGGAPAPNA